MKKQLVLAAGLAVLAAPAFASKARLQALGEDIYGSQYINDNRNIFINAANVNEYKDMVTFEWGNTANTADTAATPRAEGGVFFGHGNLVYGVQLGRESNASQQMRQAAGVGGASDADEEQNGVDIFVGGDAGIKWGASLYHSKSEDKTAQDSKQEAMSARLGVSQGAWNAFANINLKNDAEEGATEFKGKTGFQIGGGYMINEYNVFAQYQSLEGENAGDDKIEAKKMLVGVGRVSKLNDKASLFTKVSYQITEANNDGVAAGNGGVFAVEETKDSTLPVVVGLEYDAASWVSLRGSVTQNVLVSQREQEDKTTIDSTSVAAGASLKFGDMTVDGMIGNNTDTASGADTATGGGQLRTDNLMSRVSMTYKF